MRSSKMRNLRATSITSERTRAELESEIGLAREGVRQILKRIIASGGLTRERYIRFLSAHYHLTKGVHRTLFAIAAHPLLVNKPALRRFLVDRGAAQEPHYRLAEADLDALGAAPEPECFDGEVWHAYFAQMLERRPLLRLGAGCVLEAIADGAQDLIEEAVAVAGDFDTVLAHRRFLTVQLFEAEPAEAQPMFTMLSRSELEAVELEALIEGAHNGATLYLRILDHALR